MQYKHHILPIFKQSSFFVSIIILPAKGFLSQPSPV